MSWTIHVAKRAEKTLARVPAKSQRLLRAALEEMQENPFSGDIVRLISERSTWRRRVGAYRIFFDVFPDPSAHRCRGYRPENLHHLLNLAALAPRRPSRILIAPSLNPPPPMPTERKHASAQTAEVVLLENPLSPRFEIDVCRPDGVFLLAATDDEGAAEAVFPRASLML